MNLVERRDVTQATIDHFLPKPFAWDKAATCLHLIRRHVRAMGKPVPTMPRFRSALSARAAMQARGWSSLAEVMDAVLPRILPSEAIIGDVVELQSEDAAFGALCIAVGNGRVTGYFEGHAGLTVLQPVAPIVAAWRT